ncbi:MJ0936 family phosphodiesterase [Spizellomyces punctatus DAOM BR117]|uniref:Vacuolar protein sorting-associated protein 29 n=1 Tax=Spizellomyces punctatus (strain DAOM BR117) TaxID=645134 RepID=A0A0L0H634_SPIPD|nr:MJ0936 family phosphodiesterase [Spizellomyces punctatus DAOM BR117]KNC96434.1 MJ0936 family phosphodiesterase [Spizellomyces punctatus DAOM BR117]|eukprot:XP_016604474.1 MJ0936 family phosphodiesterase [Spizellomyces punctatus DAOM BR117]
MLVLIIGDFHIPHRAIDLPSKFKRLLVPGKIQQIICTGNLTSRETLDYLRTVASDILLVKGDMDESLTPTAPLSRVVTHGPLRIGVVHGHQVIPWGDARTLGIMAREMDVDILVSGHTHRFEAFEHEGRFFVNPGSATGAFECVTTGPTLAAAATTGEGGAVGGSISNTTAATGGTETTASFVLMDIQGAAVVMYVYQLINGEVRVEKLDYTKRLYD